MQVLLLLVAAAVASAAPREGGHTLTKRMVTKHPTFGRLTRCSMDLASRDTGVASALRTCNTNFCTCVKGNLIGFQSSNSSSHDQCVDPARQGLASEFDATCPNLETCYPAYLQCVHDSAYGCVQEALEQCNEQVSRPCNEGRVCKIGDKPGNVSAGGIFAITFSIFFVLFLLCACAACGKGKKSRKAIDEEAA